MDYQQHLHSIIFCHKFQNPLGIIDNLIIAYFAQEGLQLCQPLYFEIQIVS